MEKDILVIHCPDCGAPAQFDIVHQIYACSYCGGKVTVENVKNEKSRIPRRYVKKYEGEYAFEKTTCPGCGASIIFRKNEALSACEFCGNSLVRQHYAEDADLPRYVVPFGLTLEEAQEKLKDWCTVNRRKPEAEHLQSRIADMRGYYLPYEMVRGPVHCRVSKRSEAKVFEADGYLKDEFINCSRQLDNLVLDAMEPFDLNNLEEFDFAYVAGHRVKIADLDENAVSMRLHEEAEANYRLRFEKLWGTKSIAVDTAVDEVIRFPVLLPVYYITDGEMKAAVNGQTGKVSVCAEKQNSYLSVPWWLQGILLLLLTLSATFLVLNLWQQDMMLSLLMTGMLGIFYLILLGCMLSDGGSTEFGIFHYRQIYNSGEQTYHREQGCLVPTETVLKRQIADPVFQLQISSRKEIPVIYTFRSPQRIASMILLSVLVIFLPVLLALLLNGFAFARLNLAGSAVWFCITVPVVPILLIRFGMQWIYENPWIYTVTKDGRRERYRKKTRSKEEKETVKNILELLFSPPLCFAVLFVIAALCYMVYLTAYGF